MKNIVIGTLAHVDAGKTTLIEALLYQNKNIKSLGRVDHGDAFLDYDTQERNRGITIFSKEVQLIYKDLNISLLDTPGHDDFSSEMERTLSILDYAIVIISGNDGIQSHTKTIFSLLKKYKIPVFIFINKMDIAHLSKEDMMQDFKDHLSPNCIDFSKRDHNFFESIALSDEKLLDDYLQTQNISNQQIAQSILSFNVYPCFFGSALKNQGIKELLEGLDDFICPPQYPPLLNGKVYKITHDRQGQKLTHIKITGGVLKAKQKINEQEKVDTIRIYSGFHYQSVEQVESGQVCALKGLQTLQVGDELAGGSYYQPHLISYMNYAMILPPTCDEFQFFKKIKVLQEEDPTLQLHYDQYNKQIIVSLMGKIQTEILKEMIHERFHENISFDQGQIHYLETVKETIEGVGHYEPLRHYSEVHILIEPLERGSGIQYASLCHEDQLSRSYQNLILTHMQEVEHLGVLIGAPITDVKLTLLAGKAHLKHTEGGDFREATYRALRQGLKRAKSLLLEPYQEFTIEISNDDLGKVLYDLDQYKASYTLDNQSQKTIIKGQGAIAKMQDYPSLLASLSKGTGKIESHFIGYYECQESQAIIEQMHYDSESDLDHPTGSIFCQHGAGFYVPYNDVEKYMHIPYLYNIKQERKTPVHNPIQINDKELEDVFLRTYGPTKRYLAPKKEIVADEKNNVKVLKECLLVDGYNMIFSWDELKDIAKNHLDSARERLIDILCNYQGFKKCLMIIVFDAYKIKGNTGSIEKYKNTYIVYTKEAQSADSYIERVTNDLVKDYRVVVATSDALEQTIIVGHGATRLSARELKENIEYLSKYQMEEFDRKNSKQRNFLLEEVKDFSKKDK